MSTIEKNCYIVNSCEGLLGVCVIVKDLKNIQHDLTKDYSLVECRKLEKDEINEKAFSNSNFSKNFSIAQDSTVLDGYNLSTGRKQCNFTYLSQVCAWISEYYINRFTHAIIGHPGMGKG